MYVQQESNIEQCTAKKLENGNLPDLFGICVQLYIGSMIYIQVEKRASSVCHINEIL